MKLITKSKVRIVFTMGLIFISSYNFGPNTKAKENLDNVQMVTPDHKIESAVIDREEKLRNFLKKYNSPLEDNAKTFIEVADKYNMDYRMLPAIACLESSCGKKLIPGTFNPFGWGVYGNNYIAFSSYDEAINKVGEGLHKGYVLKGADTIDKIAPIYNPPNHVKWLQSVRFFMNQIQKS